MSISQLDLEGLVQDEYFKPKEKAMEHGGLTVVQDEPTSDMPEDSTEYLIDMELKPLIEKIRNIAIMPEYRSEWSDNDILGLIVSKYSRWDFNNIQGVCASAMDDANFRDEAEQLRKMVKGGPIGSGYKNNSPKQAWQAWSDNEKTHFLTDHFSNLHSREAKQYTSQNYEQLPETIKTKLMAHIKEGRYAKGGTIADQYTGSPEDLWNAWNRSQRIHFLQDHLGSLHFTRYGSTTPEELAKEKFDDLPAFVQDEITSHMARGQYAKGGPTSNLLAGKILTDNTDGFKYLIAGESSSGIAIQRKTGVGEEFAKNIPYTELISKFEANQVSIQGYNDVTALKEAIKRIKDDLELSMYRHQESDRIATEEERSRMSHIAEAYRQALEKNLTILTNRAKASIAIRQRMGGVARQDVGDTMGWKYYIFDNGEWKSSDKKDFKEWHDEFGTEVMDKTGKTYKKGEIPFGQVENIYNPQGVEVAYKIWQIDKPYLAQGGEIKEFTFKEHTDITRYAGGKEEADFFKKGEAIIGKIIDENEHRFIVESQSGGTYDIPKNAVTVFVRENYEYEHRKAAKGGDVNPEQLERTLRGYKEAILFAEIDDNEESLDVNYGMDDFDPESEKKMRETVKQFIFKNQALIKESGLDDEQVGRDFWYTRKGHGVGFWDRDLGEIGDKLTTAAEENRYAGTDLYTDGEKIFVMAKGGGLEIESIKRINNSPLLKYANFEDNSHINLIRLIKPYKSGYSFGISMSSQESGQRVRLFKTLEEAESRFEELIGEAKKESKIRSMGKTDNYAKGGEIGKSLIGRTLYHETKNKGKIQNIWEHMGNIKIQTEQDSFIFTHNSIKALEKGEKTFDFIDAYAYHIATQSGSTKPKGSEVKSVINSVKYSIADALSQDPQKDWKDSLADASDALNSIKDKVSAENKKIIITVQRSLKDAVKVKPKHKDWKDSLADANEALNDIDTKSK